MIHELPLPGSRAIFSTRLGGVSEGPYESLNLGALTDDDLARVTENRARLAAEARVDAARVAMGWQVHGTEVREWDEPPANRAYAEPGGKELPKVDGHATTARDLPLLVMVADCYPVALSDGERVAMLHCGWRGLAGGIIEEALQGFSGDVAAAVGPGIGRCCYEVGPEVLEAFSDLPGVADGRMLDLRTIAVRKLTAAGVTDVQHIDECTSCHPELYFSHRRDRGVTGRQGGMVVLDA
jgi:YfiH family protein